MRPKDQEVIDRCIRHRNRWFSGTPIYDMLPSGWHIINGTTTQPSGCVWIANGPLFIKDCDGWKFNHKLKTVLMWDSNYC